MKELSIEEKAKCYDKAIELVNSKWHYKNQPCIIDVSEIFPELKESEDDNMWKLIKKYVHYNISDLALEADHITREHLESWLEKQSKQKSVDNVEPKFKIGDWVVFNGLTLLVYDIVQSYYRTTSIDGIHNSYDLGIDNAARLWTIEDAKNGDVLSYKDEILLYNRDIENFTKQEINFTNIICHCCYDYKRFIKSTLYSLTKQDKIDIHPATKEQRNLLFQKMKQAGYEWNENTKKLIKL